MEFSNKIDGKVLIFTDQHLGLKGNSESRLKIVIKVFKEVIQHVKTNNIQHVISMGDMFHSRSQIDVNVINVGYKLVQSLAKYCKVWIIVGNHDQYLKNTNQINSINIFQDIPNVVLVDCSKEVLLNGRKALLVPWLGNLQNFCKESFDMLFGHFDVSAKFIMQAFTDSNKNKIGAEMEGEVSNFIDVAKKNGTIFSGHIHTRKEMVVNGRNLIFVGSPYQQTLADLGMKCGFYTLDEQCKQTFVEIKSAPKHVELRMSKVVAEGDAFDFSCVKDSILHKIYDVEVDRVTDMKISQKILDVKPFEELLPDYEVAVKDSNNNEVAENIELLKKSKLEYISNYIDNIDQKALDDQKLDKKRLFGVLEKYYNEVM